MTYQYSNATQERKLECFNLRGCVANAQLVNPRAKRLCHEDSNMLRPTLVIDARNAKKTRARSSIPARDDQQGGPLLGVQKEKVQQRERKDEHCQSRRNNRLVRQGIAVTGRQKCTYKQRGAPPSIRRIPSHFTHGVVHQIIPNTAHPGQALPGAKLHVSIEALGAAGANMAGRDGTAVSGRRDS
jgi:hypothetical protein